MFYRPDLMSVPYLDDREQPFYQIFLELSSLCFWPRGVLIQFSCMLCTKALWIPQCWIPTVTETTNVCVSVCSVSLVIGVAKTIWTEDSRITLLAVQAIVHKLELVTDSTTSASSSISFLIYFLQFTHIVLSSDGSFEHMVHIVATQLGDEFLLLFLTL